MCTHWTIIVNHSVHRLFGSPYQKLVPPFYWVPPIFFWPITDSTELKFPPSVATSLSHPPWSKIDTCCPARTLTSDMTLDTMSSSRKPSAMLHQWGVSYIRAEVEVVPDVLLSLCVSMLYFPRVWREYIDISCCDQHWNVNVCVMATSLSWVCKVKLKF